MSLYHEIIGVKSCVGEDEQEPTNAAAAVKFFLKNAQAAKREKKIGAALFWLGVAKDAAPTNARIAKEHEAVLRVVTAEDAQMADALRAERDDKQAKELAVVAGADDAVIFFPTLQITKKFLVPGFLLWCLMRVSGVHGNR